MNALTIGMAVFDEAQLWSTVSRLRLDGFRGPIIVVDNNPGGALAKSTVGICNEWSVKYVPFGDIRGTSVPRNKVFEHATTPWVCVIDGHIQFLNGAVKRLEDYISSNIESRDLLHGILVMGGFSGHSTHMRDEWGPDKMWGRWGLAWYTPDGQIVEVLPDEVDAKRDATPEARCWFASVTMKPSAVDVPNRPDIPFKDHQPALMKLGWRPVGSKSGDRPFEIPAHGFGVFACRKDAWPGFPSNATGFGGEEVVTQELFRDRGDRVLCLPDVKWVHCWRDDKTKPPYPMEARARVRNFLLGIRRTKNAAEHEARAKLELLPLIGERDYLAIAARPDASIEESCPSCNNGGNEPLPAGADSIDKLFAHYKSVKRDLNEHFDALAALASTVKSITAFTKRREWDVAFLKGLPPDGKLVSHNREAGSLTTFMRSLVTGYTVDKKDSPEVPNIDDTELLVLDTKHHADRLWQELEKFAGSVTKYILIRSTAPTAFASNAEGGGPGLHVAMLRFLRENPEWIVKRQVNHQWGYTLLSRDPADRPKLPSTIQQVFSFGKAAAKYLTGADDRADEKTATIRLDTCALCPMRTEDRCSQCGCFLLEGPGGMPGKAFLKGQSCPLGYWSIAEIEGRPIQPPAE